MKRKCLLQKQDDIKIMFSKGTHIFDGLCRFAAKAGGGRYYVVYFMHPHIGGGIQVFQLVQWISAHEFVCSNCRY